MSVEKIGYPEAKIILTHAVLHVARASKSASVYRSIALDYVAIQPPLPVPLYLRDRHYKSAAALDHIGCRFPYDDARGQNYASDIYTGSFYQSDARDGATFEKRADDYWERLTQSPQIRSRR